MIITAENISHYYNKRAVLDSVSLRLDKGDFTTIIGPNGAGKSTLLKCLMGLVTPSQGHITRKPESRIGYIPQRIALNPSLPMTVARFIALNKTPSTFAEFEPLDLSRIADKPIHSLSGGEWQQVLLARALYDSPDAIILDEPAQNLDISGQMQFYKILEDLNKSRDIAILMVSHDLPMTMASSKNIIGLYHQICCAGTPSYVVADPGFAELFGQDMAAMMAKHHQEKQHARKVRHV